jgi:hypothetical protein
VSLHFICAVKRTIKENYKKEREMNLNRNKNSKILRQVWLKNITKDVTDAK